MAYSQGGLIEAADINGFLSTSTDNLNSIWSTGSSDKGYGQTAVTTVAVGDKVEAVTWSNLVNNIANSASHQGTTITAITAPTTGSLISFFTALSNNLTLVVTNRRNAAAQSATTTTSSTYGSSWSNSITFTITVTFTSHNAARYFFNAGGQLGISHSHPAGTGINGLINDICTEAGTVWCSSPTSGSITLAGSSYTGITKVGGGYPAGTTTATNTGFYAWGAVSTEISKQYGDFSYITAGGNYTTDTFRSINVSYNNSGAITFTVLFDEVPNGAAVSSGTVTNLIVRPPSTTYLTNTWGTPTVNITNSGS